MPQCFIVMPITTADPSLYANDAEHFGHVLDYLFVPAIARAGLTAIRPLAEGADLIHAEIIRNIENADLVLCDMSALNPNVFFELGIRTALNKPLCAVKDDVTPSIPFDTTIVNHHTYLSALSPWTIAQQVDLLSAHIVKSIERSGGTNAMWKYFGISSRATLPVASSTDERLALLSAQVENLTKRLAPRRGVPTKARSHDDGEDTFHTVVGIASAAGYTVSEGGWGDDKRIEVVVDQGLPDQRTTNLMLAAARDAGYRLTIRAPDSDS